MARALFALTGGYEAWIKRFMRSPNKIIGGVLAEKIRSIEGGIAFFRKRNKAIPRVR